MPPNAHLLRVLTTLRIAIFTLDPEGRTTFWSEGARRLTGDEGADKPCGWLDVAGSPGLHGLLQLVQGGSDFADGVVTLRHREGHELHVLAELRKLPDEGEGFAGSFCDLTRAQANRRLAEVRSPERTQGAFDRMLGQSPVMRDVFRRLEKAAEIDVTVLIRGDTGTGKELAANAIHALSARSKQPMICLNCSAIPEPLLESELFGHVKGAFTGALRDKRGVFEAAAGGTLFLDEIGDMGPRMQVKLLRALQERQIRRVGSDKMIPVDMRVVSATNQNLAQRIAQGEFREDLYYRIRVFEVLLPPLRDREGDLPVLVEQFIRDLSVRHDKPVTGLTDEALACMQAYGWPGNVRELRNAVEHAFVTVDGSHIAPSDLPVEVQMAGQEQTPMAGGGKKAGAAKTRSASFPARTPAEKDEEDRGRIVAALRESRGKKGLAAAMLGMSRVTLWKRIKDYGIEPYTG